MFVIELSYKADLADIDAHMTAHVMFLKKYYATGNFLISGRKVPRDGGIILAVGKSRKHIDAWCSAAELLEQCCDQMKGHGAETGAEVE